MYLYPENSRPPPTETIRTLENQVAALSRENERLREGNGSVREGDALRLLYFGIIAFEYFY